MQQTGHNQSSQPLIANKLSFDFEVVERLEAGLKLTGSQTKQFASKQIAIRGARVVIQDNAPHAIGIVCGQESPTIEMLLNRREISKLAGTVSRQGVTAMIESIVKRNGKFKAIVAVCKGKTKYDKREQQKQQDVENQIRRTLKTNTL